MDTVKLTTELSAGHSGPALLRISGAVDLSSADELRTRLLEVIDAGHRRLIVDLSGTSFCDATGLDAFLAGDQRMRQAGGWLCLCGMQPVVAKIFRITALDEAFTVYATPQEALHAGRGHRVSAMRWPFRRDGSALPRRAPLPARCRRTGENKTGLYGPGRRGTAAGRLRPLARAWSKTHQLARKLRTGVSRSAGPWPGASLARSVWAAVRRGGSLGPSWIGFADWRSAVAAMISRMFVARTP